MKIAIFGGTFDPIHTGHMEAAKAAARRFHLNRVLFVPTGCPPHKTTNGLTDYHHRLAMVTLACSDDVRFVPSQLESPEFHPGPHYSVDTVRRVRRTLRPGDSLYFLIGIDALLDLPHWKQFRRLLDLTDFIVVSRPGFDSHDIERALPRHMIDSRRPRKSPREILLRRTTLHILPDVEVPVASTDLRQAIREGQSIAGLVPPLVEQYILEKGLYGAIQLHGGK